MKKIPDELGKPFITKEWKQHAELVAHLGQFSQNILLVAAPKGGGKSTFLQHVIQIVTPNLRKISLQGGETTKAEELIQKVANQFKISWSGIEATLLQIRTVVAESYQRDRLTSCLFVDDAHLLTNDALQAVLKLVDFDVESNAQFHLVLLGESSLELRLFSPELSQLVQGKVYAIELDTWTLRDLTTFLAEDGSLADLTADQVAYIFEQSRGIPGSVVRMRNTVLDKSTIAGKKMSKQDSKKRAIHPISLGVMLGVLVGGGYLLFNGILEEDGSNAPINAAHAEDPWAKEITPQKPAKVAFHFDNEQQAINASDEDTSEEKGGRAMPLASNVPMHEEVAATTPAAAPVSAVVPAPVVHRAPAAASTAAKAEAEAVKTDEPNATQATPEQHSAKSNQQQKVAAGRSLSDEEKYLLTLNKHHYTLQLLGASRVESIQQFVERHALENNTYSFSTKRADKDWFAVVYGDYPSAQAAKAAIQNMPHSLKQAKLQPWVREMQSVQDDIKKS